MRRHAAMPILVAVALVLTGCSGVGMPGQSAGEDGFRYPDGLARQGVTDASNLYQEHVSTLRARSYTVRFRRVPANGSETTVVTRVDGDRRVAVTVINHTTTSGTTVKYVNQNGTYIRDRQNRSQPRYLATGRQFSTKRVPGQSESIVYLMSNLNVSSGEVVTYEGTDAVRYDVVGFRNEPDVAEGTVVVSESGVVRHYDVRFDSDMISDRFVVEVTAINETTVSKPDWMSRFQNDTGPAHSASLSP